MELDEIFYLFSRLHCQRAFICDDNCMFREMLASSLHLCRGCHCVEGTTRPETRVARIADGIAPVPAGHTKSEASDLLLGREPPAVLPHDQCHSISGCRRAECWGAGCWLRKRLCGVLLLCCKLAWCALAISRNVTPSETSPTLGWFLAFGY
jgi:hypothetical protein